VCASSGVHQYIHAWMYSLVLMDYMHLICLLLPNPYISMPPLLPPFQSSPIENTTAHRVLQFELLHLAIDYAGIPLYSKSYWYNSGGRM